jgi:hypothetical protein
MGGGRKAIDSSYHALGAQDREDAHSLFHLRLERFDFDRGIPCCMPKSDPVDFHSMLAFGG